MVLNHVRVGHTATAINYFVAVVSLVFLMKILVWNNDVLCIKFVESSKSLGK